MLVKIVVVSMLVAQLVGADMEAIKARERDVRVICVAELGISEVLVDNANKGQFVEDRILKCYMKCLLEKLDMFLPDGSLNTDMLENYFPEDVRPPFVIVFKKCAGIVGEDTCETAYLTNKCWLENAPDLYYLI